MFLINRDDVQEMLNTTDELSAYVFKILDEKLAEIEVRAVYRECDGCFGASMGDCGKCRRFVMCGKIGDKMSETIDKLDEHIEGTPERIREWLKYYRYKLFSGKHTKRGKK